MQRGHTSTVVSLQSTAKVNIIIGLCDLPASELNQLGSWQEEDDLQVQKQKGQ
jgi:hypothetical protein